MQFHTPYMKPATPSTRFNPAPVVKRAGHLPSEWMVCLLRERAQLSGNDMEMYKACITHHEIGLHWCGNVFHLSRYTQEVSLTHTHTQRCTPEIPRIISAHAGLKKTTVYPIKIDENFLNVKGMKPMRILNYNR